MQFFLVNIQRYYTGFELPQRNYWGFFGRGGNGLCRVN